MQRKTIIAAIIICFTMSSCETYRGADGHTQYADPAVCNGGFCVLMIIAAMAGIGAAVASAHK